MLLEKMVVKCIGRGFIVSVHTAVIPKCHSQHLVI